MADIADRELLLDRLVALNGGGDGMRDMFAHFSVDDLQDALVSAERAIRDIELYGRLGAEWRHAKDEIIYRADPKQDDPA